jgi:hypothetical protein
MNYRPIKLQTNFVQIKNKNFHIDGYQQDQQNI